MGLEKEVDKVITAKGSIYQYLDNGKTQRWKKATNTLCEPQDVLVYIPNHEWVLRSAPESMKHTFGNDKFEYAQMLRDYIHMDEHTIRIVDSQGRPIRSNSEAKRVQPYAALIRGNKTTHAIPVTPNPVIGFNPFDFRYFKEGNVTHKEKHLGNPVVEIIYKQK